MEFNVLQKEFKAKQRAEKKMELAKVEANKQNNASVGVEGDTVCLWFFQD